MTLDLSTPTGILQPEAQGTQFQLRRYPPAPDLRPFVLRYWIITWDLGQRTHVQETLPHPCVNMVLDRGRSAIFGISQGKFAYTMTGAGCVFGLKFRPGGLYPFLRSPVADLTGSAIGCDVVCGCDGAALEAAVLDQPDAAAMIAALETLIRPHLPAPDPTVDLVADIVADISTDRTIIKVDDVARRWAISRRTLQRLFHEYVGVSPKWVIKRCRLHEAAERADDEQDWARLAVELGYFDQAHFIKDFKAIVGRTPEEYARRHMLE